MRSFLLIGFLARLIAGQECGQVCELDAFGQKLTFPTPVVTSTVVATTASIITYQDAKGSIIVQSVTKTANIPPKRTLTWEVSGVTLTHPTTYVIYTNFVHSFVATKTVGGALSCSTGSAPLELGTSTDFSSVIFPASEIVGTLPPSALVGYLESIPTVLAQLGGAVNSSCDPTSTTSSSATGPTETLITTDTQSSIVTFHTTTTVTGAFDQNTDSVLTIPVTTTPPFGNATTRATPPPPPTSTTPTSTSTSTSTSTATITSSSTATDTLTLTSSSSSSLSPTTTTSATSITSFSSITETFTSTSTPANVSLTTVTFTGAISSLESSPPSNFTATSPSSSGIELSNGGNQVGTGGLLASILGLVVYWI